MNKNKINQQPTPSKENKEITRKEALQKAGKYAAVTAAAMFIVLSPKDSQAQSAPPPPGW
ncbi:MAG: hypothetical protein HQ522_05275 [Bacteroidetes bacterium]|nr:hypothetical protein [Bacteroidota bacterium]